MNEKLNFLNKKKINDRFIESIQTILTIFRIRWLLIDDGCIAWLDNDNGIVTIIIINILAIV